MGTSCLQVPAPLVTKSCMKSLRLLRKRGMMPIGLFMPTAANLCVCVEKIERTLDNSR